MRSLSHGKNIKGKQRYCPVMNTYFYLTLRTLGGDGASKIYIYTSFNNIKYQNKTKTNLIITKETYSLSYEVFISYTVLLCDQLKILFNKLQYFIVMAQLQFL